MGSRILSFLFGVIFGIAATVGGVIAAGYYAYNYLTIKNIEDMMGKEFTFINEYLGEDSILKFMSAKQIMDEVGKIPGKTLTQFSEDYDIKFPEQIKFLTEPLKDVQIGQLISGETLDIVLTQIKIGDIFGPPYNDIENYPYDYTGEAPSGVNLIIWEFRKYTIYGQNDGIMSYLGDITLGSLRNVYNLTLPSFMDGLDDSTHLAELADHINEIPINAILSDPKAAPGYDPATAPFSVSDNLIHIICTLTYTDPETNEEKPYTLGRIDQLFEELVSNLRIQDIMAAPDANAENVSGKILRRIWEDNPEISNLTVSIGNIIGSLTRGDLFGDDYGFMALIPADTPLDQIDEVMVEVFNTITLGTLSDLGLINPITNPDVRDIQLQQAINIAVQVIEMYS